MDLFHILVAMHICTGAVGLVAFWIPVWSQKGGSRHVKVGRVFTICMLATGTVAVGIATTTLVSPLETHPKLDDAALVRGIFGWMMLYLAVLTINLAWYGWSTAVYKREHGRNWEWRNLVLQVLVTIAAANCLWQGYNLQGWPMEASLMMGISFVGFATVATNMWFLMKERPGPKDWLLEHIKALVGAGISVYTAFLAFGAVRLMPEAALNPALWAIPLVTGVSIIIYQQAKVRRKPSAGRRKRSEDVVAAE
ncbi:hypothetical protein [Ahrensia sp. R2A130]|uniref:hypothetical protein n=1 Tax=Ahrensia sp. R2A130 TaxID=744979 RepID=UPI0001E0B47B|nr:hypothetical protein [Ahrensia sp. R2A130]EFL90713.1 putative membrane protein [Ahrensia sp. R2A130]